MGIDQVFFTMEGNDGYDQINIDKHAREKKGFASHYGFYQFIRMPCGLQDATATF